MKQEKKFRWLDWAFEQQTGSVLTNLILVLMARFGNASGHCYASVRRLANAAGVSERSVQRALRWLAENGYIFERIDLRSRRKTRTYEFCENPGSQIKRRHSVAPIGDKAAPGRRHADTQNHKNHKSESSSRGNDPNSSNGQRQLRTRRIGELISDFDFG